MPLRKTSLTISRPLFSSDNEISVSENKDVQPIALVSVEVDVQVERPDSHNDP